MQPNRFRLQLQGLGSPRTVQIQVDAECRCQKRPKNNRNFAKSGVRSARKQPRMLVAVERFTDRRISNYTKTGVAEKTNKQTAHTRRARLRRRSVKKWARSALPRHDAETGAVARERRVRGRNRDGLPVSRWRASSRLYVSIGPTTTNPTEVPAGYI